MAYIYYVYILASKRNGTLYVGVTNNLERRMYKHKMHLISGFTQKYNVTLLVWYQTTGDILSAIQKEKEIKKWNRAWKLRLIEEENPGWEDLSKDFSGFPPSRE
ncbi:MAG: GIY-YIG nuclease family protein [Patescibacteria group bacterium]